MRLGRVLADLMPREGEVLGLLALMLLHHARRAARTDEQGNVVLLENQDRSRWDAAAIEEGAPPDGARPPARAPARPLRDPGSHRRPA